MPIFGSFMNLVHYISSTSKQKHIAKINRLITFLIKNNSRMLSRYLVCQQSYEQGGLQAPIISNILEARILLVWLKLLFKNTL